VRHCSPSLVEVFTLADVTLPSLGESVTEGIITQWFKKVGDVVARDEPLFEVSTDKVDSEMPSPAAGVLIQILAQEGDTVETGSRVAVIDESADASATPSPATAEPPSAPTTSASAPPTPARPASTSGTNATKGMVMSPVVRRILADASIDPSRVAGTGHGGSITRRDAEQAALDGATSDVVVPISSGQRRMGQHMVFSAQSTPHGFVAIEVDATALAKLDVFGRLTANGDHVSDEMVIGLAAVRALKDFAHLNASFTGDDIVVHPIVNLGVLRSAGSDGMIVPVVHSANELKLRAIAQRLNDVYSRVTSRQLTTDDLLGGTFSVLGAPSAHTLFSNAILIQPQVATMTVGAVRAVPVVVERSGSHEIAIGLRVILGLAFDHRVTESVEAAAFLERVATVLNEMDIESEL
jgi:pyruvate dehydrogenase E2 component (dihydrolipoamide acetyltransferase)